MTKDKKPNPREAKFIEQYLLDQNATQAAIRAGYSAKTAHVQGTYLLARLRPFIDPRLAAQQAALKEKVLVTKERICQELACIAFTDAKDFYDNHGNPIEIPDLRPRARRAIAGFEFTEDFLNAKQSDGTKERVACGYTKKYKLADKIRAAELLAKLLGYLEKDDGKVSGNTTIIIQQFTQPAEPKPVTIEVEPTA